MTIDGVTKLIAAIEATYPSYHTPDVIKTAKVWRSMLEDYGDEEVAVALKAFILSDTKGFAPSIGQIVALVPRNQDDGTSELAAWNLVKRAIRNGVYNAEEEFSKLPDTVRAAVGSAGQIRAWAMADIDELETVAQSNFLRSYRAVAAREHMASKLPPTLKPIYHKEPPLALDFQRKDEPADDGEYIPMPDELRQRLGLTV